jgi:thiamine pyrophosphate-dependent acetolactate synthase large subunit-like protein
VSRALGADGFTVKTVADVAAVTDAVAAPRRPVVVDVLIDPADVPEVMH